MYMLSASASNAEPSSSCPSGTSRPLLRLSQSTVLYFISRLLMLMHFRIRISFRYKVTTLTLIPSVVHQMVNHPGIEKADFRSVLVMFSGAAHLPPELGEKISSFMPSKSVFNDGYGLSEAVCQSRFSTSSFLCEYSRTFLRSTDDRSDSPTLPRQPRREAQENLGLHRHPLPRDGSPPLQRRNWYPSRQLLLPCLSSWRSYSLEITWRVCVG